MAVDQRDAGIAAHDAMTGRRSSKRRYAVKDTTVSGNDGQVPAVAPVERHRRSGSCALVRCSMPRRSPLRRSPESPRQPGSMSGAPLLRTLQGRLRFCEREAHGRAGRRHVLGAVLGVAAVALAWMRDCPLGARRAPQPCRARPRTAGKHRCAGQRCGAPVRSGPAELWTTVGDVRVGWLGVDAPLRSVFLAAVHLVLRTRDGGERGGAGFPLRGCA